MSPVHGAAFVIATSLPGLGFGTDDGRVAPRLGMVMPVDGAELCLGLRCPDDASFGFAHGRRVSPNSRRICS